MICALFQLLSALVALSSARPEAGYSYSPPSTSYGAPSGGGGGFSSSGSGGFSGGTLNIQNPVVERIMSFMFPKVAVADLEAAAAVVLEAVMAVDLEEAAEADLAVVSFYKLSKFNCSKMCEL